LGKQHHKKGDIFPLISGTDLFPLSFISSPAYLHIYTILFQAQGLQGWSSAFNERRCKGYATTSDLIAFGYQIASGMKFLNRKNVRYFIQQHSTPKYFQIFLQELVLHNILLKRNFIIQIADFGLSRLAKSGLNGFDAFSHPFPTVHNAVQSIIRVTKLESNWRSLCALLWELFQMGTTKFNFSCQSDGSREFQDLDLAPLET
jgi:serine/threonine protein kinase